MIYFQKSVIGGKGSTDKVSVIGDKNSVGKVSVIGAN